MPSLSCFIDEIDVQLLLKRLNDDPEIAIILADGPKTPRQAFLDKCEFAARSLLTDDELIKGVSLTLVGAPDDGYRQRWKAVERVDALPDGQHCLWHIPAGPLPLLTNFGLNEFVANPWEGWTEHRSGAEPMTPFFGQSPAVIHLSLFTRHRPYSKEEQDSPDALWSFWDRETDYLVVSNFQWGGTDRYHPAIKTKRWWNRLRAWVDRTATRVCTASGIVWALPSARDKLYQGMDYYASGRIVEFPAS